MVRSLILGGIVFLSSGLALGQVGTKEWQIETALLAAPDGEKESASVRGYNDAGEFVWLREGSGTLICVADDPEADGFSVASYHRDLEPYMEFGRELRTQGMDFRQVFDAREEAVKSGGLQMPDKATLCVLTGEVNEETGEIENAYKRYVVYIPYATSESTGLPLQPASPGAPWIMDPGTHRAHIMINPPR